MALANAAPRRPGRTLYHYLLREMTLPTLFTLLILTVLFLTEDMLRFSELVMNRGLGAGAVASISLYKAVPAVTWSLPFAALMGVFIALGRLGTDRELLAIEASGVSYARLVRPVLLFSTLAAAANLALSNFAAPAANRALDATLEELAQEKPWSTIEQGHVQRFGDWKLHAREVSPGGDRLTGVQLWMPDVGETVFAESGTLDPGEAGGIEITLSHGAVFLNPRRTPRLLRFETLTAQLPSNLASVTRTDADRLSGSTLAELLWSDQLEARVELHRRFALPAASLAFGLLALPLFLAGAGFSRSGGWVLALGCTLIYYVLVQLTNGLVLARTWSPGFGVWLPDLVFLVAGALLALRLTRMSAFGRDLTRPTHRQPAESARPLRRRFGSARSDRGRHLRSARYRIQQCGDRGRPTLADRRRQRGEHSKDLRRERAGRLALDARADPASRRARRHDHQQLLGRRATRFRRLLGVRRIEVRCRGAVPVGRAGTRDVEGARQHGRSRPHRHGPPRPRDRG